MYWLPYYQERSPYPPDELLDALPLVKTTTKKALDVGCGCLIEAHYLANQGFAVTAFDPDPYALLYAEEYKHEKISFFQERAETFSYPKNTFDLICAMRCLSYVPEEHIDNVMQRLYASLVVGGVFVFEFLVGNSCKNRNACVYPRERIEQFVAPFREKTFKIFDHGDSSRAQIADIVCIK